MIPDDGATRDAAAISARRRHEYGAARADLASRCFTASSDDRCVTVTVDGSGAMVSLGFTSETPSAIPPDELGARVLQVLQHARQMADDEARRRLVGILGHSPPIPRDISAKPEALGQSARPPPATHEPTFEDDTHLRSWR